MTVNYEKAPFPWPGGKSLAAETVWGLLGDPGHYVEPFAGSLAVLLGRPADQVNRPYFSETVNDADGLVVNAWRAIQLHPGETAEAASWPVSEADVHARHVALIRWREEHQLEHLMGDPVWCDATMAGWWLWGVCCWIGSGWCRTECGPWWPDGDDRLTKWRKGDPDRPRLPDHSDPGVWRQLPHVSDDGKGVNRPGTREPGVGDAGEFHEMTMPELRAWMQWLSARLRHVRILNGDWARAATPGAVRNLTVRSGKAPAGVFLDPPYSAAAGRASDLYTVDSLGVAVDVREWCIANGDRGDYRIVLAGFEGEGHEILAVDHGWTEHSWYKAGHLTGGYANQSKSGNQQQRERLWASPACITEPEPDDETEGSLFAAEAFR